MEETIFTDIEIVKENYKMSQNTLLMCNALEYTYFAKSQTRIW